MADIQPRLRLMDTTDAADNLARLEAHLQDGRTPDVIVCSGGFSAPPGYPPLAGSRTSYGLSSRSPLTERINGVLYFRGWRGPLAPLSPNWVVRFVPRIIRGGNLIQGDLELADRLQRALGDRGWTIHIWSEENVFRGTATIERVPKRGPSGALEGGAYRGPVSSLDIAEIMRGLTALADAAEAEGPRDTGGGAVP